MNISFYLLFLCAISINVIKVRAESLPVIVWGSENTIYQPALQDYSSENFADFIQTGQKTDSKTVTVVFFEDNLSNEDLTLCKHNDGTTCFAYLKSVSPKSYITSVENPLKTLKQLGDKANHVSLHLNTDGSLEKINPIVGSNIFVSLADTENNEDRVQTLSRHDEVMKKFVQQLSEQNVHVLAVYTGKHTPLSTHSVHKRQAETTTPSTTSTTTPKLIATTVKPDENKFFNLDDKLLIIYQNFTFKDRENDKLHLLKRPTFLHKDNIMNVTFTIDAEKFSFAIVLRGGNWNMEDFLWNNIQLRTEMISINLPFSYHCGPGVVFHSVTKLNNPIRITWAGLQIQPRFNGTGKFTAFGDSWDCVGFMTPAILSGLFVTFIMIYILSMGFAWMFDIRTMDRFDDPKGKTITVTEME